MRSLFAVILAALTTSVPSASGASWPMFGAGPQRTNVSHARAGVNVSRLTRRIIRVPGTVDSAPIAIKGRIVMTTSYGRTFALDERTGRRLWTFTPAGIARWEGSSQITNATPAADPGGKAVYAASPDGVIHKLSLATGRQLWARSITRLPSREKIASALNVYGGYVIATTGGYVGDAPPYQGHVVTLARRTGRIRAVFNSLCSDVRRLLVPSRCSASDSAIWGRAGAVIDRRAREIYVATGNGPFNGTTNWGDSMLVLSFPDLRLKRNWTPYNQQELTDEDKDLGSVAPALLPGGLVLQGGKDARMDLLSRAKPNGRTSRPSPRLGGGLQRLDLPGRAQVLRTGAPAVDGRTVYVATDNATTAYRLANRRLREVWSRPAPGTTPVVAGGDVYVYNPLGRLNVYTRQGRLLRSLPAGAGHWNAPIAIDGRVWLPEGNANDHATTGTVSLYR